MANLLLIPPLRRQQLPLKLLGLVLRQSHRVLVQSERAVDLIGQGLERRALRYVPAELGGRGVGSIGVHSHLDQE